MASSTIDAHFGSTNSVNLPHVENIPDRVTFGCGPPTAMTDEACRSSTRATPLVQIDRLVFADEDIPYLKANRLAIVRPPDRVFFNEKRHRRRWLCGNSAAGRAVTSMAAARGNEAFLCRTGVTEAFPLRGWARSARSLAFAAMRAT